MCENITKKSKTPLRNSNSANKPFRSPLTTIVTPINNASPKNDNFQSPMLKTNTPKRSIPNSLHPVKRRRINSESSNDIEKENDDEALTQSDLVALKTRVCKKRQELENLKRKLHYVNKHTNEDLTASINKWRSACKEALLQLHKIIVEKEVEGATIDSILSMLGISNEVIKLTDEEREELGISV